MAITVVQAKAVSDSLSGSFTTPTTAGNTVVICIGTENSSNVAISVSGITLGGSAGNFAQVAAVQSAFTTVSEFAAIWCNPNCAGGQSAVVISGSNLNIVASSDNGWVMYEVSGLLSTSSAATLTDKTSTASATTGTAVSTGTTAATTQASEIAVAALAANNSLSSFTAGYTATAINDGSGVFNAAAQLILSSTGTQSFGATEGSSGPWAGCIATFKAATGGTLPPAAQVTAAAYPLSPPVTVPVAAVTAQAFPLFPGPFPVVAGTWTGSYAVSNGFFFPYPSSRPVQVTTANTAGDWLFALVAWRPSTTGSGASVVVADDAHNWWEPVGAPATDSGAAGGVRTAVWAAPAARVANSVTGQTVVQVAATGPVLSLACTIIDMANLLPWYQVAMTPGSSFGNAVSSLAVSAGGPPAQAVMLAAFASDDNSKTITGPAGWTALAGASASNGVDHTADIRLTPAWQVTSAAPSASVSSSGSLDLAGVIAGVLVSAPQPAQPNPNWPVMVTEAAIGSGVQTPPSQMTWTTLSGRSLSLSARQGKSYSLGQLQAGQGALVLDNPDGSLIPPGTGSFAGIDSGTPLRRRVTWPGLPGGTPNPTPNYVAFSGYLRRWPFSLDSAMLRGQTQAELTDVWGYGAGPLNSMAVEESLIDLPRSLWPMTDPAGAAGASNIAAGNSTPLNQAVSKFGAGGATAAFGVNSGALPGAGSAQVTASGAGGSSGMWQQVLKGTSLAFNGYGYALQAADASYPAISGGVTVETWAQPQVTAAAASVNGNGVFVATASTSPAFAVGSNSYVNGQAVVLSVAGGFGFPSPFSAGTTYYVVNAAGNGGNFDLAATQGGTAIACTASGSGFISTILAWNPVLLSARDGKGTVFGLSLRNTDGALLLLQRNGTTVTSSVVSALDWRGPGLAHYSLAVTQATWRLLVNGGSQLAASGSFSPALPASFRTLCLAGVQDPTQSGYACPGYFAFAGVYPGVSPQVRVISRGAAADPGISGEAACDRAERLLEYAGLTGRRWLGQQAVAYEGDLMVSGRDIGGQAAVSSVNNVVSSTLPALAYVAPTGDVVYRSKLYTWNEPVRWTLGDATAAGEIPFSPGTVATDYDPTRVTADVQVTQLDTQAVTVPAGVMSATTMTAVAAAAGRQYGGQPYQQSGYLDFDWSSIYAAGSSLQDLANWVQAVYRRPQNRVQQVTVDAASHPAAWPFWAGASVGDMVAVNVRLPTAATSPLISLTARITQTDRSSQFSQDGTSATITATLDFAPEYNALTCDDPVRGLLNGTNVLPW